MSDKEITDEELYGVTSRGNITQFPGKQEAPPDQEDMSQYILICPDCKCTTFQVKLNGDLTCAECEKESSEYAPQFNFARHIPENTKEIDHPEDAQKILRFQGEEFARSRVVKKINEWYKDNTLMFAVAYTLDNGAIQWTGIETVEEREWAYTKIEEMKRWLASYELPETKED